MNILPMPVQPPRQSARVRLLEVPYKVRAIYNAVIAGRQLIAEMESIVLANVLSGTSNPDDSVAQKGNLYQLSTSPTAVQLAGMRVTLNALEDSEEFKKGSQILPPILSILEAEAADEHAARLRSMSGSTKLN